MNPQPNQSETPRTDAEEIILNDDPHWPNSKMGGTRVVKSDFARQLERELTASKSEVSKYRGLLYGCDEHRLWNGLSCIGCIESERDTFKAQLEEAQRLLGSQKDQLEEAKKLENLLLELIGNATHGLVGDSSEETLREFVLDFTSQKSQLAASTAEVKRLKEDKLRIDNLEKYVGDIDLFLKPVKGLMMSSIWICDGTNLRIAMDKLHQEMTETLTQPKDKNEK